MGGKKKKPNRQKTKTQTGSNSKSGSFIDPNKSVDVSQDDIMVSQYSSTEKEPNNPPDLQKLEEEKTTEEVPVAEKQDKVETTPQKEESAKKEEEDSSVLITKDKEQPAVVDDHLASSPSQGRKRPALAVGIEKLKLSDRLQSEDVQSPMKVKKTQLANLQTSSFAMKPSNVVQQQNASLQEQMTQIQRNFEAKQSLFSELQRLSESELEKSYNSGELKGLKDKWAKELEIKFEPANEEENAQLVAFNNENKQFFDKIEEFMHILEDWADEHLHRENGQKAKPNRPPRMGIEMFKNVEPLQEIESPFRKKKTHLQRLDFSQDKLKSCEQTGESKDIQNKLEELFKVVMNNFQKRQDQFEQYKAKSNADLLSMYQSGELQTINKNWQKELELQYMGGENTNHEQAGQAISEFMHENEASFKKIESFLTIVGDWVEETCASNLSQGTSSKESLQAFEGGVGEKLKPQPDFKKATEEAYARIQVKNQAEQMAKVQIEKIRDVEKKENTELANDIDSLQKLESQKLKPNDDDLLQGLEDLKTIEKKQLEERQATFTPRSNEPEPAPAVVEQPVIQQTQPPKEEPKQIEETQKETEPLIAKAKEVEKEDKGDGSGINPTVVIVAALALAGVMVLAKKFYSK